MTTPPPTPEEFEEILRNIQSEVRRIANDHPDVRYIDVAETGECNYYPNSSNPHGCIIGYACRNLGFSLDDKSYGGLGVRAAFLQKFYEREHVGVGEESREILERLAAVQGDQDHGLTWREAVEAAG